MLKIVYKRALEYQKFRYQTDQLFNGTLSSSQITKFIHLKDPEKKHLEQASSKLQLSARALLKSFVFLTLLPILITQAISIQHLSEAISFNQP